MPIQSSFCFPFFLPRGHTTMAGKIRKEFPTTSVKRYWESPEVINQLIPLRDHLVKEGEDPALTAKALAHLACEFLLFQHNTLGPHVTQHHTPLTSNQVTSRHPQVYTTSCQVISRLHSRRSTISSVADMPGIQVCARLAQIRFQQPCKAREEPGAIRDGGNCSAGMCTEALWLNLLQKSGHLKRPTIFFSDKIPEAKQSEFKELAKKHGAKIATSASKATHIVEPDPK